MTPAENVRRGEAYRGDYCGAGHEWTEANTYTQSNGGRGCIECRRRYGRESYHRTKARRDRLPEAS